MLRRFAASQQHVLALVEKFFDRKKSRSTNTSKVAIYGEKPNAVSPTTLDDIESCLVDLDSRSAEWRNLSRKDKSTILKECIETITEHAVEIATVSTRHKGTYGQGVGEEYLGIIPIITFLSEAANYFERDSPMKPHKITYSPDHTQWIVDVFPSGLDTLAFGCFQGELWICPGHGVTQGVTVARAEKESDIGVGLVLGAGNQYPLAVLDIFHVLLMQSRVVVCKLNPVNEYMGPILRKALSPLIERGYVEFVYGGSREGEYLVDHKLVKSVHLTGSNATFDGIVWRNQNDKTGEPPFKKPVHGELGCVTPYIIVPGNWSEADIEYHANTVVSGLVHNSGHNCLKAEVLVIDRSWKQREQFLDAIRRILNETYMRTSYYPGSEGKFQRFRETFPDCEEFGIESQAPPGEENGSHHKWILQTGLTRDNCKVSVENWCGVLQEVAIDSGEYIETFFNQAGDFVNEQCWGTLSCTVLIHPLTEASHKKKFEKFISDLKYGSICINVPGMVGFGITSLTWGAYGDESESSCCCIGSGNVKVHNTGFFDHVQKSVVRGPWCFHPFPYWLVSNRNCEEIGKAAVMYFRNKSITSLWNLLLASLKG